MSYIESYKLFFTERNSFESLIQERRSSESAVQLPFTIGKYSAFFVQTQDMQKQLTHILRQDKQVYAQVTQLPPIALQQFTRKCMIDEIVLTNDIEGVRSTRREIGDVLNDLQASDQKRRFVGLVNKYIMLQTRTEAIPKTCAEIRALYDDLVSSELAKGDLPDGVYFRKGGVSVLSPTGKALHQGLLPEARIIEGMQQALLVLQDESIDMLIRIAIFHYMFGYIHPFYDGNGRTSRYISSAALSTELEPITAYRLSYAIQENKKRYYEAFEHCNDPRSRGDLTEFIHMFLFMVQTAQSEILTILKDRYEEWTQLRQEVEQIPSIQQDDLSSSIADLLIQAALFSEDGITVHELSSYCECSEPTIRNRLKKLRELDVLFIKNINRKNYYQWKI